MSFLSTSQYLARPRPQHAWLIKDIIPVGGFAVLYAKAKSGKSFLALDLIEAISNPDKTHFLNHPIGQHGPVLYLQLDEAPSSWVEKVEKVLKSDQHNFTNVFWADRNTPDLPYPFNFLSNAGPWLKERVTALKPVLVVIDTVRDCHGGDENDSSVMAVVVAQITAACMGVAIMLIAHPKKEYAQGMPDLLQDLRGSTYIVGRADVILALRANDRERKGTLALKGRAIEETTLALARTDCGTWELDPEENRLMTHMIAIMNETRDEDEDKNIRAKRAKMLIERLGVWKDGQPIGLHAAKKQLERKEDWLRRLLEFETMPMSQTNNEKSNKTP